MLVLEPCHKTQSPQQEYIYIAQGIFQHNTNKTPFSPQKHPGNQHPTWQLRGMNYQLIADIPIGARDQHQQLTAVS